MMRKLLIISLMILVVVANFGCSTMSSRRKASLQKENLDSNVQEYLKGDSLYQVELMKESKAKHDNSLDSFIVEYRQKISGYKVKAILKPSIEDVLVFSADLYFTKNNKTFMLHTKCFGDTVFCKGRYDPDGDNVKILKRYNHKTLDADYTEDKNEREPMILYKPFFFKDLDFDDIPELVVVHKSLAVRYHNGYDVYRIVEGVPFLIDYLPYYNNSNNGFGMTDYPRFDFAKKTISCPNPEGENQYTDMNIYGISKNKDKIKVNGRIHYFNKMEKVKVLKFE